MKTYTLDNKPQALGTYRKTATIRAVVLTEPFVVETQEGAMTISPDTVDDWQGGYVLAYPSDGSKPYAMARRFFEANYERHDDTNGGK